MASQWHVDLQTDNFDAILADSRQQAGKLIAQTGRNLVEYVKEGAPEKSGFLKSTIEGEQDTFIFYLRIGAYYWPFLNDGTRYIAPMHFVEHGHMRAIAELRDKLAQYWKEA
jgi:hypothetical protein